MFNKEMDMTEKNQYATIQTYTNMRLTKATQEQHLKKNQQIDDEDEEPIHNNTDTHKNGFHKLTTKNNNNLNKCPQRDGDELESKHKNTNTQTHT